MISGDILNGSREMSPANDQMSSGRRFIYTSLSSSSEDECLITLTASSLSLDSSDISSHNEDSDETEVAHSPPVQMHQSESSGISSGTMTVSGSSSSSSSPNNEIQYAELRNSDLSDEDSEESSFQDADISSSSHDSDEVLSGDIRRGSCEELLIIDLDSDESSYLIDQASSSAEDDEISSCAKRYVLFQIDSKSSSADEESSLECSINYQKYTYESSFCSSRMEHEEYWYSSKSSIKMESKKSDLTVENISKKNKEKIKREDVTHDWVLRDNDRCSELVTSSKSSKTAKSGFEELGFRDTFASASSTKPKEFSKSSKQISAEFDFEELGFRDTFASGSSIKPKEFAISSKRISAESDFEELGFRDTFAYASSSKPKEFGISYSVAEKDDDVFSGRQSKVTFAPPENLVAVRYFERTVEEEEDDAFFRAIVADELRFRMRITMFQKVLDPFLTQEHRSFVMTRNGFLSMDI